MSLVTDEDKLYKLIMQEFQIYMIYDQKEKERERD